MNNRRKLYHRYEGLQSVLSPEKIDLILDAINIFLPIIQVVRSNSNTLFVENDNGKKSRAHITNSINQVIAKEKDLSYRDIIKQSIKLEEGIRDIREIFIFNNACPDNSLMISENKINTFFICYEIFTRKYTVPNCFLLSIAAYDLDSAIKSTRDILNCLPVLAPNSIDQADIYRLDLYLPNVNSLKSFAIKLNAVSVIYSEISCLCNISEHENPLIIEHLENGSLWLKIAGHTLTATILTSVLTFATDYYHDNYSTTGQLKQLPISVETADELLKISEQLKKMALILLK